MNAEKWLDIQSSNTARRTKSEGLGTLTWRQKKGVTQDKGVDGRLTKFGTMTWTEAVKNMIYDMRVWNRWIRLREGHVKTAMNLPCQKMRAVTLTWCANIFILIGTLFHGILCQLF
jgi:hypothetical protein